MQIGILKMPPSSGIPLQRARVVTSDKLLRPIDSNVLGFERFNQPHVLLGTDVIRAPRALYKSFRMSFDGRYIFETVYSDEGSTPVCLYTKIISSSNTEVLISLEAVRYFGDCDNSILPLTELVGSAYWRSEPYTFNVLSSIIPAVFDQSGLDEQSSIIIDAIEDVKSIRHNGHYFKDHQVYQPLIQYEPGLLEALIGGKFIKHPTFEPRCEYPLMQLQKEKWFISETSFHKTRVSSGVIHLHHPEFDTLIHELIVTRPASISMTVQLSHALEGLMDLSVTRRFHDPYLMIIPISPNEFETIKATIRTIIFKCVLLYCQLYNIDPHVFADCRENTSSITIEKNIYDEGVVSIHDLVNDRYVCFYSYYPLLSLGTMGCGRCL